VSVATDVLELNLAGGARICVPASLDQITPYVLLEQEDWFEEEIRFLRQWLQPGMRAIDAGASFGVYTLAIARAVGPGGRVWSFEPTEETARYLATSLERNACANVDLQRLAVSNRDGILDFRVGDESEFNAVAAAEAASGEVRQVPAASLDRFAEAHGLGSIDFLKLDVEGHELEALEGAKSLLKASSPLVMFEIQNKDIVNLRPLELLVGLGYGFYRVLPGPLALAPFDPVQLERLHLLNLFACKPDRAGALAAAHRLVRAEADHAGGPALSAWSPFARRAAYARELAERWPAKAGFFSGGGLATYLEGLAAYAHSRDEGRSLEERHSWLNLALRSVNEALDAKATLARRMSLARIAGDLGFRAAAYEALVDAVDRLAEESGAAEAEPFLAPSLRYEKLPMAGNAREWLTCAVIEQFERRRALSSVFVGASSLEVLAQVRGLAPSSPEIERRWQLVRLRHGLQARPEASPALRERSDENLNPELWARGAPFAAAARR